MVQAGGRVGGHAEDMDPSGLNFHDEQDVESAQGDGVEGEEIGGQQAGGLSAQEAPPAGVRPTRCRAYAGGGEISMSLAAVLRASNLNAPNTLMAIRYSSRNSTVGDHGPITSTNKTPGPPR